MIILYFYTSPYHFSPSTAAFFNKTGRCYPEVSEEKSVQVRVFISIRSSSVMTIYNIYIFNKNGTCLYYNAWNAKKTHNSLSQDEEFKLMYGMIFSIKSFISRMSEKTSKDSFVGYKTSHYKLHYYESPTGIKIILNTDTSRGSLLNTLQHIYRKIFVEYVTYNPECKPDCWVESELFVSELNQYVKSLNFFA